MPEASVQTPGTMMPISRGTQTDMVGLQLDGTAPIIVKQRRGCRGSGTNRRKTAEKSISMAAGQRGPDSNDELVQHAWHSGSDFAQSDGGGPDAQPRQSLRPELGAACSTEMRPAYVPNLCIFKEFVPGSFGHCCATAPMHQPLQIGGAELWISSAGNRRMFY